ncbi:DUF4249 domain-containing protein [Aureibaculum algae]|uniref:DUF4249 domain-containing protein n=1 Tax=Aureibaculum algae TaxID=2584122 RepID=A0A5B7TW41_9FLAO|nr:DUF4249 domain-containing protein [Aureibaculum algae]QCX39481.1 DUF4249 domain-containing protein [Aureibaculum algae]
MKLYPIKKNRPHRIFWSLVVVLLTNSCIEPFEIKTQSFENAIVVEALITNEYKTQQIKLSNSFSFEDEVVPPETDASVYISDDNGNRIDFTETSKKGTYDSEIPFAAESGNTYQLFITTSDNRSYQSKAIEMSNTTQIENVYAERSSKLKEDGVSIFIDSHDDAGNSKYYRYEFEETYKIVAPDWVSEDLVIVPIIVEGEDGIIDTIQTFEFELKTTEQQTCYKTDLSKGLILTETTDLSEDRIEKFEVRFIKSINPIISYRYSILVKQFVLSIDAYTYYKTLKKISSSDNGIVQNQPGFLQGNISSIDNPDEKVIGFFEVSTVSEKRMFFNYRDLFVDEDLPPYFIPREYSTPLRFVVPFQQNQIKYVGPTDYIPNPNNIPDDDNPDPNSGPYKFVTAACGDCRILGNNVKPDFWYE